MYIDACSSVSVYIHISQNAASYINAAVQMWFRTNTPHALGELTRSPLPRWPPQGHSRTTPPAGGPKKNVDAKALEEHLERFCATLDHSSREVCCRHGCAP